MGFTDLFQDFYASLSFTELHAEAAPEEKDNDDTEDKSEGDEEGGDEKKEGDDEEEEKGEGEDRGEEGGDKEGGDDEEEEDEEEAEEPEDPKPKIEEACANSSECAPAKHHYEECVERVTVQHSNPKHKGPKEDCVEEFFHLQHCATQCAAPKLFRQLK